MSTYISDKILLPNHLDEIGLQFSTVRLDHETLSDYKNRLLAYHRKPIDNNLYNLQHSFNREIGIIEKPVLILKATVERPKSRVLVTSSFIRLWEDYTSTEYVEIDIHDYRKKMSHVTTLLTSYPEILTVTTTVQYDENIHARELSLYDSLRHNQQLLSNKEVTVLQYKQVSELIFTDNTVYKTEVSDFESIAEDGDFYVDYYNGIVFSKLAGKGAVNYNYFDNDGVLYTSPVKGFSLNDEDIEKRTYTDDKINHIGVKYYNELLGKYPLTWGL